MAVQGPELSWGSQPLTRREALIALRNTVVVAGGIALGAAATEVVVEDTAKRILNRSRIPAEAWIRMEHAGARDMPWHVFPGRPGLFGWLRWADQPYDVAMLAVDKETMDAKAAELPPSARHAVAWYTGGDTLEVGVLPSGVDNVPETFAGRYAIGMGIGSGELRATMGLWAPEGNAFVIPEGVEKLETVKSYDMHEAYPGALWV